MIHGLDMLFHHAAADGLEFVFSRGQALCYPMHTHAGTCTITVVRRGVVVVEKQGGCLTHHPGTIYVDAPDEPHAPSYGDSFDIASLCLNAANLAGRPLASVVDSCSGYMNVLISRGLLEPCHAGLLLGALEKARSACQARAAATASRERLFDDAWRTEVDRICPRSVSPFHFIRLFREQPGLTPHRYLAQHRIRLAQKLLRESDKLTETARAARFCDQSHLNRWFSRLIGISPAAYQKACHILDLG